MVRFIPADFYQPTAKDDWSQTTSIIINTQSGSQVTLNYKLRDKWTFKVGAGLSISNIIFEAVDSVINVAYDISTSSNCTQNPYTNCCSVSGSSLTGSTPCIFIKKPYYILN